MKRILSLCDDCAFLYSDGYSVKKLAFGTTTKKEKKCAQCGKIDRYGHDQYLLTDKKGNVF